MQRTRRSFYNVIVTVITNIIILMTAFYVQRVFVAVKGSDYNGINGLFTSVISMMSLTDLGIGSAIMYHLYRPVAEENYGAINSLLRFYRNSYLAISGVVLILGIIVALCLPVLTKGVYLEDSLYLIFILFMADCLCSYFLSYKKSLLYAYQMNYVLDSIHFFYYIVQNMIQILILLYTRDYILFLIVKTVSKCIENITITFYIKKKFPLTCGKKVVPLEKETKNDIVKKVKALVFHRLGALFVTGSDSLVITGVLGIADMSRYTNYNLILGGISALLNKIFETLTSTVGNFLLESSSEARTDVYRKIEFLNFWLFGTCSVVMYAAFDSIITLWVGEYYLFPLSGVFALTLNFYIRGMRQSVLTFKNAAGIYYEDRFTPLLEAVINLSASIVLAKLFGIAGVFIGTMISSGVAFLYSYPKYVCYPLFQMKYWSYIGSTGRYLAAVALAFFLMNLISRSVSFQSRWSRLIGLVAISGCLFQIIVIVLYGRSREAAYFVELLVKAVFHRKR